MRTGCPQRLVPAALLLALAGCDDSRASQSSASANTALAAPAPPAPADAVHYVRAVDDPYPRNGYCTLGACTWFETRSQQVIGSSEHERQIRVTLAMGRSNHPGSAWPADASRAPVRWSSESEEVYVFCSRWRPAVTRRRGEQWEQARIDLVAGMGDFTESSRSIYGLVCHLEDDWAAEGFFARRGYRTQPGEAVARVADPENRTYIHPHDPDRPEMGGIAVSHSAPPPTVTVRLEAPPAPVIEYRPPPRARAMVELLAVSSRGEFLGHVGSYPTREACERAREARANVPTPMVCIDGESGVVH